MEVARMESATMMVGEEAKERDLAWRNTMEEILKHMKDRDKRKKDRMKKSRRKLMPCFKKLSCSKTKRWSYKLGKKQTWSRKKRCPTSKGRGSGK